MKQMTVGIIGCGVISGIYLQNMTNVFPNIKVKSCCARRFESAQKRAAEFGIAATTVEEMLADPEIEMVVILTPPATHFSLIKQALEAGIHLDNKLQLIKLIEDYLS